MHQDDRLSRVIGEIYDAALDPALWSVVLGGARDFVGGSAAAIYTKDVAARTGAVYYDDGGVEAHYKRLYVEEYATLDPATGHFLATVENPLAIADIFHEDEYDAFLETRFNKEWLQPQGIVDNLSAVIEKSMTTAVMFGVLRYERDGIVDEEAKRRMRLIAPHVQRAVLIGKAIDLKAAQATSLADAFDGLSAGMFLTEGSGHIVHANAAGDVMLAEGDFLYAASGRLVARDAATNHVLKDSIVAAASGDAAAGIGGIAVPLISQDHERYVAHVLPLTSARGRWAGIANAALAALFVHKAAMDTPSLPESIARHYKLTPTELRVLLAIVEVGGAPEVAEALGIGTGTVKTHLGRLYQKTGTRRQVDLVKLVAGFSSPLLS